MAVTDEAATTTAAPTARTSARDWWAVCAVAAATFAMVTVEALPVGLLTPIGHAFSVSEGAVALTVTLPGLLASLSAAVLPVLIGKADRRTVLLALLTLMLAGTAVSALAPDFAVLLVARALVGVAIGGFWALAASVAVRLVSPGDIPRATSLAFGGATVANVLGVPMATLLGNWTSWRVAFLVVAALGLAVALLLWALLPGLAPTDVVSPRLLAAQLRNPAVRYGVTATFLLVGGHWAAFTFVRPVLQKVSGLSDGAIGPAQLAFGIAGVVGTFAAGAVAGRGPRRVLITAGVLLAVPLALFPWVGTTAPGGVALLLAWGLAFGAVPVGVQTWILQSAPDAAEAASALNTAMYNLAVAVGALAGGIIVGASGNSGVLRTAAGLALLAVAAVCVAGRGPAKGGSRGGR